MLHKNDLSFHSSLNSHEPSRHLHRFVLARNLPFLMLNSPDRLIAG